VGPVAKYASIGLATTNEIMKTFRDPTLFFVAYLALAAPALSVRIFGLDPQEAMVSLLDPKVEAKPLIVPYLTFVALLIVVAWLRGRAVERRWLVALPVAGLVFALLPPLVKPAVVLPVLAHATTLVIGLFPARRPAPPAEK
jgi:hypothetical protein